MPRDAVSRTANVGTWLRKRNDGQKWDIYSWRISLQLALFAAATLLGNFLKLLSVAVRLTTVSRHTHTHIYVYAYIYYVCIYKYNPLNIRLKPLGSIVNHGEFFRGVPLT